MMTEERICAAHRSRNVNQKYQYHAFELQNLHEQEQEELEDIQKVLCKSGTHINCGYRGNGGNYRTQLLSEEE